MYKFSKKNQPVKSDVKNYLGRNQPFTKFVEAANNLTKLIDVGKHFTRSIKTTNNFRKFVEFAKTYEVRRIRQQLYENLPTTLREFANNFTRICQQLYENSPTTLRSLWDSQKTFMKFVEAANNFTKFVGLANNFLQNP